ncbi:MAG TPA: gamma-glutamyltransferase, partial [bacterium]|nr:gamma-glutamyltransferase [bacterium]
MAALASTAGGPRPFNDLVAEGEHGVVVTQEPHATAVGLEVLRRGGNAVDAAVAVALTLAVTFPQAGNLGGGGFLVFRRADGEVFTIDFREQAPASAARDMYLKPDGSVDVDKVQHGVTAAGVPGSPAGLLHALHRHGTRSLETLAAPAIRLAREGFVVDRKLAGSLWAKREVLARYPSTRAVFFRDGAPLRQGDILVQKDLAATLQRFAEGGLAGFYDGR